MKTPTKRTILLGCLGAAFGALLTSCVDPYYAGPQTSERTVTTYRTGYEVRTLPPGYRTETIAGTRYYHHNGTYFQPRSGRYVVVEAPRRGYDGRDRYDRGPRYEETRVITRLPRGYRTVNHRGVTYYQVNDSYYQRRGSGYVVVSRPF